MRYAALATILLFASAASVADADSKYFVYGVGNESCGKWLASRTRPEDRLHQTSWLLGWVSAAGFYDVYGTLKNTDVDAVAAWTDNYCHDHPLENLSVAAGVLVKTLAKSKD